MAAYDNAAMPSAPGAPSYAAPIVDFSTIGDLANSYYKGQQQKRQLDVQNAFKGGLPTDSSGQPDYNAMAAKLFQLGDYGGGTSLANTGIQRQQLQMGNDLVKGPIGQLPGLPGQTGAVTQPQAAPSGQTFQAPPVSAQPSTPSSASPTGYSGGDNGKNTVASAVMSNMPAEQAGPVIAKVAAALGVDPNQPLPPDQYQRVGQALMRAGVATPTGGAAAPTQVAQAAPQVGAQAPAPAAPVDQNIAAAGEQRLQGMSPERRIQWLSQVAASPAVPKSVNEWAAERLKAEYAATAPTTEQKNANASGVSSPLDFAKRGEQDKDEVTRFGKKYDAVAKSEAESSAELPKLELAKSLMNSPGFYSGSGEGLTLGYKRLLNAFGGDPNAAAPQEAFRKVISDSILSQIRSMAGTGQIRVAEIKIMERAAANMENTQAANRLLVETATRMHQRNLALGEMARNYKGGRLDPGFDGAVRQYDQQHPMFSKAELSDPRLVSPPIIGTPAAVGNSGLPKGSPFLTPDGRVKYVP